MDQIQTLEGIFAEARGELAGCRECSSEGPMRFTMEPVIRGGSDLAGWDWDSLTTGQKAFAGVAVAGALFLGYRWWKSRG